MEEINNYYYYLKTLSHLLNAKTEYRNTEINNAKDIDIVMPIIIQKHLKVCGNTIKMIQMII